MSSNESNKTEQLTTSASGLWLLPDGVEESLPSEAAALEKMRRSSLDRFRSWGFEQVDPPLVEFIESLLISSGGDLDLQTVRVTDQMSGRMLGVRADMTPQVARIDAHRLNRDEVTRLCYVGSVLHARPDCFGGTRVPLQIGAELFGHGDIAADLEVASLMIETVLAAGGKGAEKLHIDLGHVSIYREMAEAAELSADQEDALFEALQRKAVNDIAGLLAGWNIEEPWRSMFAELANLSGGMDVLKTARGVLADAGDKVKAAIDSVECIATALRNQYPNIGLHVDLAELRGYRFHTGVVFAAFVPGTGQELARGGRYDCAGAAFGRARPATGFTADLKLLLKVSAATIESQPEAQERIWAPLAAGVDAALDSRVRALRDSGRVVVRALSGPDGKCQPDANCTRQLQRTGDGEGHSTGFSWELAAL